VKTPGMAQRRAEETKASVRDGSAARCPHKGIRRRLRQAIGRLYERPGGGRLSSLAGMAWHSETGL
jgi:hypothetical protein